MENQVQKLVEETWGTLSGVWEDGEETELMVQSSEIPKCAFV